MNSLRAGYRLPAEMIEFLFQVIYSIHDQGGYTFLWRELIICLATEKSVLLLQSDKDQPLSMFINDYTTCRFGCFKQNGSDKFENN